MQNIASLQNRWKPRKNTGKTRFNREKSHGMDWTKVRATNWGADYVCKEKWVE